MIEAVCLTIESTDYRLYRELLSIIEGGNRNCLIICYNKAGETTSSKSRIEITLGKIDIDLKYIIQTLNQYQYEFINAKASVPVDLITISDMENFIEYIELLISLEYVYGLPTLEDYRFIEDK